MKVLFDELKAALNGDVKDFEALSLSLFQYQSTHNPVYAAWLEALGCQAAKVDSLDKIPYLPVSFFKTHAVRSNHEKVKIWFKSSGTTGQTPSKHGISNLFWYETAFLNAFKRVYGSPEEYVFLALLPHYIASGHSSLLYMVDGLIKASKQTASGFYLQADNALRHAISESHQKGKKVFLWGVTYALLEWSTQTPPHLHAGDIVLETGGMKGRGKELVREALHSQLKTAFGVNHIHSEYGMTELLSQAYSTGDGLFSTPPWMKIQLYDAKDPLSAVQGKQRGGINIIDLANVESCAFIQTQDIGELHADGQFEVLGRFDHSELRGCNLLLA